MYEVGTSRIVKAFHVMPGMEGPEGVLHSHDYRIDVVARRDALDERGMVCDLDVLDAALTSVASEVENQDLEKIRPAEADAVTVEVFARWAHGAIANAISDEGAEWLSVRVFESDVAFGGYDAPLPPGSS